LTVEQINARFENDVERFSDITKGLQAAVDSIIALELIELEDIPRPLTSQLDLLCGMWDSNGWTCSAKPAASLSLDSEAATIFLFDKPVTAFTILDKV